MNLLQRMI